MNIPNYCYAYHPSTNEPIKIMAGKKGYFEAPYIKDVKKSNEEINVGYEQSQSMLEASMFGWHILGFEKCPKCNEISLNPNQIMNALSRRDNETFICSNCGSLEALEDMKVNKK